MRRVVLAVLVICSWSLFAQEECPSFNISCEEEVAAAGAKRGAVVANDCGAAKAFLQFCNRAVKSRRTRIYDLNEAALAAIENGRRDALGEAVQKLNRADGLARSREDLSCQAVIINNLGMAHYRLAELDDAIDAFTRAADYAAAAPPVVPPVRPEEYAAFTPTPGTFTCFGQPIPANEIITNRGLAHLRAGHFREAEQDYETVAADGASDRELDLLDMLGTAALDRKDYGEAMRISAKMRQASTAPARIRRGRIIEGIAQFRAGRLADAITAYEAAAAAGGPPDEIQGDVHLALAELYLQLDPPRVGPAVERYEKAAPLITERARKDRVVFGLGAALIRRGVDMNNAADIRRGIQELSPFQTAEAKSHIAFGHYGLGEFADAGADYETLATASDTSVTAAATSYFKAKDWSKVVGVTDNALASPRGTEEQRLKWTELRGYAHHRLNHLDQSRGDLEKVAAGRYPNADKARLVNVFLAASCAIDDRWEEARRFSEAALATPFPASEREVEIVALTNAAVAYENQVPPDFPKAIAAHERLLALQPDNRDRLLARADAYGRAGDAAKASTLYEELITSGTVPPRVHTYVDVHLASRAFCAGRLDEAERLYRQALTAEANPVALIGLADVLYVRGRQVKPLAFNDDLAAADAQYASIQPIDDAARKHIAAMRGHIAYIRHDWATALGFYANADSTDATVRKLVEAATRAKEVGDLKILPILPEDLGSKCRED